MAQEGVSDDIAAVVMARLLCKLYDHKGLSLSNLLAERPVSRYFTLRSSRTISGLIGSTTDKFDVGVRRDYVRKMPDDGFIWNDGPDHSSSRIPPA